MSRSTQQPLLDELVGNAHGNLARVRQILDEHPELLNDRATWNETAIEAATQMGNRQIIDDLVERGAQVDFFTNLVLGQVDDVGAERANSRGVHDLPALYFAAIGGHVEVAKRLLTAGADVNAAAPAAAPIHGAVVGGSVEMVRLLLDSGANPSLVDHAGRDARALALEIKRQDIADMFDR